MVGKLIKHDLIALFRLLLFISCFALGFAILARIFMTTGSSFWLFMFIMSLWASIALMFVASIGSIVRFYKSLFTGQGYMTFSLPVSVTKLLIAKLLSAIIATVVGVAVFIVCMLILMSGLPAEQLQSVMNGVKELFENIGVMLSYDPLISIETILLIIISIPMGLLQYYLCLSIGQLFSKHRVGWSYAIIILSNIVLNILFAYCLMPIVDTFAEINPHLALWTVIIVFAGLDVGYFFLIRYLLSHKLNLLV